MRRAHGFHPSHAESRGRADRGKEKREGKRRRAALRKKTVTPPPALRLTPAGPAFPGGGQSDDWRRWVPARVGFFRPRGVRAAAGLRRPGAPAVRAKLVQAARQYGVGETTAGRSPALRTR